MTNFWRCLAVIFLEEHRGKLFIVDCKDSWWNVYRFNWQGHVKLKPSLCLHHTPHTTHPNISELFTRSLWSDLSMWEHSTQSEESQSEVSVQWFGHWVVVTETPAGSIYVEPLPLPSPSRSASSMNSFVSSSSSFSPRLVRISVRSED